MFLLSRLRYEFQRRRILQLAGNLDRDTRRTREELAEIRRALWVDLARRAVREVPFYRDYFSDRGYRAEDIRELADLKLFPIIDKKMIQEAPRRFLNENARSSRLVKGQTSGTTGKALVVWQPAELFLAERAAITHQWRRVGYLLDRSPLLAIRARPNYLSRGSIVQRDKSRNVYNVSVFQLQKDNFGEILELIQREKIEFIHTYPSTAVFLAGLLLDDPGQRKLLRSLKALLLSSENLFPGDRKTIEEAFLVRVFSHYGHAEHLILGGECAKENDYHLVPRYGLTEIIFPENDPEAPGELVGTTLQNWAMPLIRYRTGDFARWQEKACSCGLSWPRITGVIGKYSSLTIHGARGGRFSLSLILRVVNFLVNEDLLGNFRQYRFIQERAGELVMEFVPGPGYNERVQENISRAFSTYTDNQVHMSFRAVHDIPPGRNGKQQILLQQVER